MPTLTLDGRAVAYDEAGGGPAPPLLCVHGFTGGREDFAPVLDGLAADRRVVAVDLPGHGGSEGADDPAAYGLGTVAGWVLRLADALDLGEVHLLGHSLGGLVAQHAAAAASHRLRSLVLAGAGVGAVREEAAERIVRIALAFRDGGPEPALEASLDGEALPPEERTAALERFRGLQPAAVVGAARNLVQAAPLGAFLRGIDVPVLVVTGAEDDIWRCSEQRLLAATANGGHHVVLDGAGHTAHEEQPAAWLAAVRPFLRAADARLFA
jgi:pimeloyl-ACP methyl ester carboxylesterase